MKNGTVSRWKSTGGFNVSWVEEQAHVALYPEWLSPDGGGSAAIRIS